MRLLLLCLVLGFAPATCTPSDWQLPLWGGLTPGPYPVGLRMTTVHDAGRAVEVTTWYPAATAWPLVPTRFAVYLRLSHLRSDSAAATPAALRQALVEAVGGGPAAMEASVRDEVLDALMGAAPEAVPAPGPFPLVLWSVRHGTPAAQAVLNEYLASHGFVVASVRPASASPPWSLATAAAKAAALDADVAALRAALAVLRAEPAVDAERLAVLAWSYGGESAVGLQQAEPAVDVVVSLGSNALGRGVYRAAAPGTAELARPVPYVLMAEAQGTDGQPRPVPAVLDSLPVASYYVRFGALAHGNFNVLEGMIPGLVPVAHVQPWSKGGPVARLGYETIARYTRHFLDAYLNADGAAADPLAGWAYGAGLPEDFAAISRHGTALDFSLWISDYGPGAARLAGRGP